MLRDNVIVCFILLCLTNKKTALRAVRSIRAKPRGITATRLDAVCCLLLSVNCIGTKKADTIASGLHRSYGFDAANVEVNK